MPKKKEVKEVKVSKNFGEGIDSGDSKGKNVIPRPKLIVEE